MAIRTAIKVSNLTHTVTANIGDLTILKGINIEIKEGESVAIVGSSGSGKSTLLGLLAGLDVNTSGEIVLYGQAFSNLDEEKRAIIRGKYVGFIFQSFHLLPSLQAIENVMLPAELKGDKDARKKAELLLDKIGLSHRLTHYPNQLSGGEQQRVAIARALIAETNLILADEPTGNLDFKTSKEIFSLFLKLKKLKKTIIFATHNREIANRADYKLFISNGGIKRVNAR